jgi:pimeloyl-ACP methyl ester carboxylesterase
VLRFQLALSLLLLSPSALPAQDIAGQWQGTLHTPAPLRIVLKVCREQGADLKASLISLDQDPDYLPVTAITATNGEVSLSVRMIQGTYQGKMNEDGTRIDGTWNQGMPLHLEFQRATEQTSWLAKSTTQLITVSPGVSLEVIDWGGSGPPLVFLAGLGNTAHIFDTFAPKFAPKYHIYGITRRGFGASSSPPPDGSNYSADQLGDDVLRVIDALGLQKPVLVGHSIAGEELSSIGSRYPDKIAGLVYLDAGYAYALYAPDPGDTRLDAEELQRDLNAYLSGAVGENQKKVVEKLLAAIPQLRHDLETDERQIDLLTPRSPRQPGSEPPFAAAASAIIKGEQKYTNINVPILAIFASPHDPAHLRTMPAGRKSEFVALDHAKTSAQARAFKKLRSAKVVIYPNADHYVFFSNEQEVEKEMTRFLGSLGPAAN